MSQDAEIIEDEVSKIRRRWSRDGGMGNERSEEDYTDEGCRILARAAFADVETLLARVEAWEKIGRDANRAAVKAMDERDALQTRLDAVGALFNGGPDTSCRTVWQDGIECVSVPLADLLAAFIVGGAS